MMIKSLMKTTVDYILDNGLYEMVLILGLRSEINKLNVDYNLGLIKHCHYVIKKNELNFNIKQLSLSLERKTKNES